MNTLEAAIAYYDELLSSAHARETSESLQRGIDRHGLRFDGRPVCNVLRPYLLDEPTYARFRHAAAVVADAMDAAYRAVATDAAVRRRLRLAPRMDTVLALEPPRRPGPIWNRLDGYVGLDGELRFLENNTTPTGPVYMDLLADVFDAMPVMAAFRRRFSARAIAAQPLMVGGFRALRGDGAMPSIAVPDFGASAPPDPVFAKSAANEFPMIARVLVQHGATMTRGRADEFRYANGALTLRDQRVDLVLLGSVGSLAAYHDPDHPVFRALREGAARSLNSVAWSAVTGVKSVFEVMSDPDYAPLGEPDRAQAASRHVPWTRLVYPRTTTYRGERVELLPLLEAERERFVLKPDAGFGGAGVVLGAECDRDQWLSALARAQADRYVAQERLDTRWQPYPVMTDAGLAFEPRMADFDMFVWHYQPPEGALVRLSDTRIQNLTAGRGSVAPLFIVRADAA